MVVLTHRGLEPGNPEFPYYESSREAFTDQLNRGYGLEFDVNFSKDGECFIFHDLGIGRLTQGSDDRKFDELSYEEIQKIRLPNGCHFIKFDELLNMFMENSKVGVRHALHLKHSHATHEKIESILNSIAAHPGSENRILIFDLLPEASMQLKSRFSNLLTFASVAHPYDIQRYGPYTGNTLMDLEEFKSQERYYDGAWLDEWDTKGPDNQKKELYTKETFSQLRKLGKFIGLVTPELHAKSPGLLGGEAHEDGQNKGNLMRKIIRIAELNPDYICTDYPELLTGKN